MRLIGRFRRRFLLWLMAVCLGGLFGLPASAWADRPFLATDRADPVEKGLTELEAGFLYQQFSSNNNLSMMLLELTNGILNDLDFEVEVPILFLQSGNSAENGLGDVNLKAKARLLRAREGRPVTLAAEMTVKLPTCNKDRLSTFNPSCTGKTDLGLTGIASKSFQSVTVHLNVGYTFVGGNTVVSPSSTQTRPLRNTVNYSLAMEYPVPALLPGLEFAGEVAGHTSSDPNESVWPLTGELAATYAFNQVVTADAEMDLGLTNSAPVFAVGAGVSFHF
ncbi:MAG TPA: transporter [Nitrospiria bacterium]|nr:transporter [Nitrospiria bacterium]